MTPTEAGKILTFVVSSWPNFPVNKGTGRMFAAFMEEYEFEKAFAGLKYLAKTLQHSYPPAMQDIVQAVDRMHGAADRSFMSVFDALRRLVKRRGAAAGRELLERHRSQPAARLGLLFWERLCFENTDRESFLLRDMREAWAEIGDCRKAEQARLGHAETRKLIEGVSKDVSLPCSSK